MYHLQVQASFLPHFALSAPNLLSHKVWLSNSEFLFLYLFLIIFMENNSADLEETSLSNSNVSQSFQMKCQLKFMCSTHYNII